MAIRQKPKGGLSDSQILASGTVKIPRNLWVMLAIAEKLEREGL
jgi:hypothetical protein